MPPSHERKTAAVMVENRDEKNCVLENEPKRTVSLALRVLFMLCFYALSSRFLFIKNTLKWE